MNITFYSVSDSPKKLEKNLTNVIGTARALAPTGQINVLNPTVSVAWDTVNGNRIISANYAYIDTFNRYYWITCGIDTAQRIVVSGKVDYLMSWADYIKNCPCTVIRNENIGINYVVDKQLPLDTSRFDTQGIVFEGETPIDFNGGLVTPQYIMITR